MLSWRVLDTTFIVCLGRAQQLWLTSFLYQAFMKVFVTLTEWKITWKVNLNEKLSTLGYNFYLRNCLPYEHFYREGD